MFEQMAASILETVAASAVSNLGSTAFREAQSAAMSYMRRVLPSTDTRNLADRGSDRAVDVLERELESLSMDDIVYLAERFQRLAQELGNKRVSAVFRSVVTVEGNVAKAGMKLNVCGSSKVTVKDNSVGDTFNLKVRS